MFFRILHYHRWYIESNIALRLIQAMNKWQSLQNYLAFFDYELESRDVIGS